MIDAFAFTTVTQGHGPTRRSKPTRNSGNANLNVQFRQCLLIQSGSQSAISTTKSLMPLYSALPPAISIESLTCSHNGGETYQLNDVSYVLPRGSKQGLVGRNGCGKSTLLKILASACCGYQEEGIVYQGKVTSPRDVRVGFCEQEPLMPSDVTVADALLGVGTTNTETSDGARFNVVRTYRLAFNQADQDPDAFAAASAAMDSYNAWSVLTKAEEIASKLRVHHLQDKPYPIQWLSDLILDNRKLTILVVTHDRAFLETVCRTILELDRGSLYSYDGNYAAFLEQKEARLALEDAALQNAKANYKTELEWMRRQPQARQTKSKSRIDAFYKLQQATKPRVLDPNLNLGELQGGRRRLGGTILKLNDVSLAFGPDKVLLDNFSYDFIKGDRIGIVGRNGVGKSTFIRILYGAQAIDSGSVERGETLVFGVYDQMGLVLLPSEETTTTVMQFVLDQVQDAQGEALSEAPGKARKLLTQFEFPRPRWMERVSMLSGGERRRLQLLSVLSKNPNFLILDEPSNDLDLNTLSALESYLQDFEGVLVIVSHDKFFTDKVTDHLFVFEGNGAVKDYLGSLSEYAECLIEQEKTFFSNTNNNGNSDNSLSEIEGKSKSTYKEDKVARNDRRNTLRKLTKEMDNTENSITKLKARAAALQSEIESSDGGEGWSVLADLTAKWNAVNEEIDEKETRWLELAEAIDELQEEFADA
ncbi:ABC transporter [Fragilaria crotonensis]|nr:ABC transporter [Fragilaria crotonensis]